MIFLKRFYIAAVFLPAFLLLSGAAYSQGTDTAVNYLDAVIRPSDALISQSWEYMSASSHSKNPKTIENKRLALVRSISDYLESVKKMKPFNSDDSLRQAALKYLTILLNVTKQDYGKIVDMKEVAEESYDNFEAYILAQKKAHDKLEQSSVLFETAQKTFAAKYKIVLTFSESDLSKKIKKGSDAIDYYNKIHLILFKPLKQEAYLLQAKESGDIGKIEQNRKTLSKNAADGVKLLSKEKKYDGDDSLIEICSRLLDFYKTEADEKAPAFIDYLMKNEAFEKTKKAFDSAGESEKTREAVDRYNEKVKELNAAVNKSNSIVKELNDKRSDLIDEWNEGMGKFFDKHVPN
jgi:hypothetical protein